MPDISSIQAALVAQNLDGWLFFDHHHRDPLAYRVLGLPGDAHVSRRWYYYIPATGEPRALLHRIEPKMLDTLPGEKSTYAGWAEQHAQLKKLLHGQKRVAMQYSPLCAVPYVATVDAGTIELVRSCGIEVMSSADLVQLFEARLSKAAITSHFDAGKKVDLIRAQAFTLISERTRAGKTLYEHDIKQFILERFADEGLTTDHGPDIAVNGNSSNPHYDPKPGQSAEIRRGDFVLIDMWAKFTYPDAIYYDITWTGFCGDTVPDRIRTVFEIVKGARDAAVSAVTQRINAGNAVRGFEIDDAARTFITERGYGEQFFHRTGHSIGASVHGNGTNIDNLESHDDRLLIAGSCFSIEPGIYLPDFGVRSELNMMIDDSGVHVTGEVQQDLVLL